MRHILFSVVLIGLAAMLSSCNDGDENKLLGSWKDSQNSVLTLSSDHTFKWERFDNTKLLPPGKQAPTAEWPPAGPLTGKWSFNGTPEPNRLLLLIAHGPAVEYNLRCIQEFGSETSMRFAHDGLESPYPRDFTTEFYSETLTKM